MSFKCSQYQLSMRQACLAFNVLTILKLIECPLKIISLWKRHVEIFQRYYSPINCTDVLWWSYLIKIDEISKSTFHNKRGRLNFLKCCDDYIRRGQKSSESVNGVSWWQPVVVCDELDGFQIVRGRDAERSAVTIRILCWFIEHMCSRHVYKISKKIALRSTQFVKHPDLVCMILFYSKEK